MKILNSNMRLIIILYKKKLIFILIIIINNNNYKNKQYMVLDGNYYLLEKKLKNIINTNNPKQSIDLMSKCRLPESNKEIGKETALKIYNSYSENSVKYDSKKYQTNINTYKEKVNNNVKVATKYSKKNIK